MTNNFMPLNWGKDQSEWLRSKSLQIINAGEGVEKREPSMKVKYYDAAAAAAVDGKKINIVTDTHNTFGKK